MNWYLWALVYTTATAVTWLFVVVLASAVIALVDEYF
jgi:hypothetical protein